MYKRQARTLFEWDNETLAPKEAGELTSQVIGVLSGEYFEAVTCDGMKKLLKECREQGGLTEAEAANVRELSEELEQTICIPQEEYQEFARLTARATSVWALSLIHILAVVSSSTCPSFMAATARAAVVIALIPSRGRFPAWDALPVITARITAWPGADMTLSLIHI